MNKIKTIFGLLMMISAMLISDRPFVLITYITAALTHEMGHLIMAKILKIRIKEICFDFSGVRICVDEKLTPYSHEIMLAFAGPCVNILLAGFVLSYLDRIATRSEVIYETEMLLSAGEFGITGLCGFFVISSIIQATINLMPARTFDGGRMLYCAIACFRNSKTADSVVEVTSACLALVIWTVAIYLMLKVSAGLGIYVFSASVFAITLKDTYYVDKTK